MEVIVRGTLPSEKIFHAKCSTCGTIFQFKQGEFKYGDQRDPYAYVKCPLCNKTIYESDFKNGKYSEHYTHPNEGYQGVFPR